MSDLGPRLVERCKGPHGLDFAFLERPVHRDIHAPAIDAIDPFPPEQANCEALSIYANISDTVAVDLGIISKIKQFISHVRLPEFYGSGSFDRRRLRFPYGNLAELGAKS